MPTKIHFILKLSILSFLFLAYCGKNNWKSRVEAPHVNQTTPLPILTGAEQTDKYLPYIQNKRLALVVNQTSRIGQVHLLDSLIHLGIHIQKILAPEHGYRGDADAGEDILDGKDAKTGVQVVSIYGNKKKPSPEDLSDVDVVLFDVQDVGARFYTYIYTLSYLMEACVENHKPLLILDRPNPNGHYVDGPVLKPSFRSFVGMFPIPLVHGLTIGEYAQMVNGENWLNAQDKCELHIIPCANYHHQSRYDLPVKPSPNLREPRAVYLYPSLCLFEGTVVSVGRGTDKPFQVYGCPESSWGDFMFEPHPIDGAKTPLYNGKSCRGFDLSSLPVDSIRNQGSIQLSYLIDFYNHYPDKANFFLANHFFDKLAGTDALRNQIMEGKTATEIRASWQPDLEKFRELRRKYLLYPE